MVKKIKPVVVWDKPAYAALQRAYNYIKEDSLANADRVREGILKIVDGLPDHPEKHPPDKYKKKNRGNYRAFEKYSYRVVYKIALNEITILRIRHVKQEPKEH